jgi:hypothetical protein
MNEILETPSIDQLARIIGNVAAPAFLLGAVASFISVLVSRIYGEALLVPLAGIEPALLAELDFESSASTNSATGAYRDAGRRGRVAKPAEYSGRPFPVNPASRYREPKRRRGPRLASTLRAGRWRMDHALLWMPQDTMV